MSKKCVEICPECLGEGKVPMKMGNGEESKLGLKQHCFYCRGKGKVVVEDFTWTDFVCGIFGLS